MMRLGAGIATLALVSVVVFPFSGCVENELPAQTNNTSSVPSAVDDAVGGDADASNGAATRAAATTNGEPEDATFDDIKLDLEKDEPFVDSKLTPDVENLFGQQIRIRGYILPSFQQSGITQFVLVRDNQECCFGPGAALYDCIVVEMVPGKSADYSVRPVTVEGRFTLNPILDIEGKHLAIYHIDGESVE